ncbi:hypothetical protein Tco_0135113, partial [Tanacetum coccineum]
YALTVNPTIYTSCLKQLWATAKVQTVNKEVQIQSLVDGKKVIVTKTSVRRALHLKDAKGKDCLPTATIFAEFERMGSTMASAIILFLDKQVEDMSKHKEIYVTPSHTKKIFANMKRNGKGFSGRITPLFQTMTVQAHEEVGEGSAVLTNSHHTTTQPSTSRPQKKQSRRKQRKDSGPTEPLTNEAVNEEHVLAMENTNTSQAANIATLKEIVKKLEKKRRSRTYNPRRLYKVGLSRRIKSSDDASLGTQEDASKQGRKIADLDADTEVTLIDDTQGRNDEDLMFDTGVLNGDEVCQEPMVNTATTTSSILVSAADPVTTAGEVVTTASVEILEDLTLSQTLIEIKSAKPRAVTTVAIIVTPASSRPKAKGIAKDKGKEKMVEPEKPLKKKDQIAIDEEVARNLEAQLQAKLEEEERLSRQKEVEANIALIESWDNTQAMMDADFQLAQQMQIEEQGQLSIEEKLKLFVELLEKRKKHFAALRAQEKRNKPPTKAQKRNTMSTYLKNMAGYKHNQLKSKSYDKMQEMFNKEMKRVNTFVEMDTDLVKGSKAKAEGSSKKAGEELEYDNLKKQRIDEHVEAKGDDD